MSDPAGGQVLWAIAVLDSPARSVSGTVGPFTTPGAAETYAHERRYADWKIVPTVWVTTPAGEVAR